MNTLERCECLGRLKGILVWRIHDDAFDCLDGRKGILVVSIRGSGGVSWCRRVTDSGKDFKTIYYEGGTFWTDILAWIARTFSGVKVYRSTDQLDTTEFIPAASRKSIEGLISFLTAIGPTTPGIFRRSPDPLILGLLLRSRLDVDYTEYCPYTTAALLKAWIRNLPTPLIGCQDLSRIDVFDDDEKYIDRHFDTTDQTLQALLRMLAVIASNPISSMTAQALSVVWTPNLIHLGNDPAEAAKHVKMACKIVEKLIERNKQQN